MSNTNSFYSYYDVFKGPQAITNEQKNILMKRTSVYSPIFIDALNIDFKKIKFNKNYLNPNILYICRFCGSSNVVSNGKHSNGNRRIICKDCKKSDNLQNELINSRKANDKNFEIGLIANFLKNDSISNNIPSIIDSYNFNFKQYNRTTSQKRLQQYYNSLSIMYNKYSNTQASFNYNDFLQKTNNFFYRQSMPTFRSPFSKAFSYKQSPNKLKNITPDIDWFLRSIIYCMNEIFIKN